MLWWFYPSEADVLNVNVKRDILPRQTLTLLFLWTDSSHFNINLLFLFTIISEAKWSQNVLTNVNTGLTFIFHHLFIRLDSHEGAKRNNIFFLFSLRNSEKYFFVLKQARNIWALPICRRVWVDRFVQLYSDRFIAEFSVIVDEAISHLKFIVSSNLWGELCLVRKYSENDLWHLFVSELGGGISLALTPQSPLLRPETTPTTSTHSFCHWHSNTNILWRQPTSAYYSLASQAD